MTTEVAVTVVEPPQVTVEVTSDGSVAVLVAEPPQITVAVSQAGQIGPSGEGVPTGGGTGQVLAKTSNADFATGWVDPSAGGGAVDSVNGHIGTVVLAAADVGADTAAARDTAITTAVAGKANTMDLTAEATARANADTALTAAFSNEATTARAAEAANAAAVIAEATARSNADAAEVIARNAAIATAVAGVVGGAPGALDTLKELADAVNDDASFAASVTSALAGKQPLDADLTAIAALTTTAFGRAFLTMADAAATKTALALVKGDVGLGNVDNTADTSKPVSTAQAAAIATAQAASQPVDADLTTIAAIDATTAGALATDGAGWVRKTYAQLKTALGLVKADVGLGSVDNTADTAKPVSTAQAAAIASAQSAAQGYADTQVAGEATVRATADGLLTPKTRQVTAGTGLTGGGDLTADRSLALADSGVTAGTYTPATVTVDAKGRITAASSFKAPQMPTGAVSETIKGRIINSITLALATVRVAALELSAGDVVHAINTLTGGTAAITPTHHWSALLDLTGKVLAVSADGLTAAIGANVVITDTMGSPYTVPSTGLYYVAFSATAGTTPTLANFSGASAAALAIAPVLCGTAGVVAAPPAVGSTLTVAASSGEHYAYVT